MSVFSKSKEGTVFMLSNIAEVDKKVVLNFAYDFLCEFDPRLSRRSSIFKSYNKRLREFKGILHDLVHSRRVAKEVANSLFLALLLIRRNEILRSNITRGNIEFAFSLIIDRSKVSRRDLRRICRIMVAHYRIERAANSGGAFQIFSSLCESGAASEYEKFMASMAEHVEVLEMYCDFQLS